MSYELSHGEALEVLRAVPDCCVDSVVMDPPYSLGFMNKAWDTFEGRDAFVAFMQPIAAELLRVLKPGGFVLSFGGTRTYHWLAWAVEGAGFEVRDMIEWMYGQGFPKSLDVAKAFDKAAGVEPLAVRPATLGMANNPQWNALHNQVVMPDATTAEAREWEGWGTALKPAHEPILMARKPLEGTVIENVRKWRTGAINVDGCRVECAGGSPAAERRKTFYAGHHGESAREAQAEGKMHDRTSPERYMEERAGEALGRFPANVILSHDERCVELGTRKVKGDPRREEGRREGGFFAPGSANGEGKPNAHCYGDADGTETVEEWACVPGCPVRMLDQQSGQSKSPPKGSVCNASTKSLFREDARVVLKSNGHGDSGGASRFFYQAKPAKSEKNEGCEHVEWLNPETGKVIKGNAHPTCKSIAVMRYLCRLVTPPGGIVLDPFMGSGTTGVAALQEGFNFAGIERDPRRPEDVPSFHIARARIEHAWRKLAAEQENKTALA